jgi:transcriptional regulator with XRE-family HTH domain/AcrR family transcriptional regulator
MLREKRILEAMANEQLRRERQRRGWSRSYIAEQIGVADPKTIGRWERGDAFPSAYFLPKLCTLFQMSAEDLGLWQRECVCEPVEIARLPLSADRSVHLPFVVETAFCDPALPPAHADGLVGRGRICAQLENSLSRKNGSAVVALNGLPGAGKTALAVELAHNREIQRRFQDGILWVSLGPDADVLEGLKRWGDLLEIEERWLAHPESIDDWSRAIHARIGARAMLLLIDDAWNCQDALAFKIGGPNCAYIITTRIPSVALYFSGSQVSTINPLDEEESLELLARFVPQLLAQEPGQMRELVRLAGGLPLALQLMGTHLQAQVYSGQPRRWRASLERLQQQPEARQHLTMPHAPLEPQMGLSADALISLQNEIALSYWRLAPSVRQALLALVDLPGCARDFTEEVALALPGVTLDALDSLLDMGLLVSSGQGRYTLHMTIGDFAVVQREQSSGRLALPPGVSVLRRLRERGAALSETVSRQSVLLEDVLPVLAVGADELLHFAPARLS